MLTRFSCIALLLTLPLMARAQTDTQLRTDWANRTKYAPDNQRLNATPADPSRAVFMGNSITESWPKRQPAFWAAHPNYVGRGISGQTTDQMLVRFRPDVLSLKPAVVIINAGINDVAENNGPYDPAFTFGNIVGMVELARAAGVRVVLASVLPAAAFPWRKTILDVPRKVMALNDQIKAYAEANSIVYLDYFSTMADAQGGAKPGLTDDGVHPTLAGYEVMGPLAEKAIMVATKK